MSTDIGRVIDEIQKLPHWKEFHCKTCQTLIRVHVLRIYAHCPGCGLQFKSRAFGGVGTELQDMIDAVLEWAGTGETLEAVLERHREIISDIDEK